MSLRARRGVTLVEALVVLALIAFAASVAALNAPPPRGKAKEEAERFAARLDAAFSAALVAGAPVRLDVEKDGYAFKLYDGEKWAPPAADARLGARRPKGVAIAVVSRDPAFANEERDDGKTPTPVLIDPLGGDGVAVAFAADGGRWIVAMDRQGAVTVKRDDR
ncbi:MAG: GspH/FimT family pseudopilin [Parvularculaceae bacterium]|nr:GspH/FimT family pseudopilin [Parvularculaceae bacterium]